MAVKTANVLARIEPDIKMQAEEILAQLGVPASVVINMLYKQIVLTRSIPFSISLPKEPVAAEDMSKAEFDAMMQRGMDEAKEGKAHPAKEVFEEINQEIDEWSRGIK